MNLAKEKLKGKRLLLLGGSLWKDAIRKIADEYSITLIATGNDASAGIFEISDEKYNVNSIDSIKMKTFIKEKAIDGVYMGGSETVISSACQYLNELNMPCYCTKKQWDELQDKSKFKSLCKKHGLPVVNQYFSINELRKEDFPVIVKPTDGCGSSGFSVCYNEQELLVGIERAKRCSQSQSYMIENFVKNDGVVVFYTVSNGKIIFSGLEDKYPVKYEKQGSYVGGLFVFESKLTNDFREKFESQIQNLISDIGICEGTFWIEIFKDEENYFFNEVGYRYGGSASIYPIDYMYNINQVASDIYYALTGESKIDDYISIIPDRVPKKKYYAVYPIYSRAGEITSINGQSTLISKENIVIFPVIYSPGKLIEDRGTFSQVVALAHFVFDDENELKETVHFIHSNFHIIDQDGDEMVYKMLNIDNLYLK